MSLKCKKINSSLSDEKIKLIGKHRSKEEKEQLFGIKYLVLCRVLVGKCFITSKEYSGLPVVDKASDYDTLYNPSQVR